MSDNDHQMETNKMPMETWEPVITTHETTDKLKRNIGILAMIGLSMSSGLITLT